MLKLSDQKRVLLVDDEAMLLKLGGTMLKRINFDVITAGGGNEALSVIEKEGDSLDLLITDMNMPDLTGVQLAEIVQDKYPTVKIVILTGLGSDDTSIFDNTDLSDIHILGKPFRLAELEELMTVLFK
jgi:DNA-binding response OmpR family regulator